MNTLRGTVQHFLESEEGPTAAEYAVMLALIILVAMATIAAIGEKVSTMFANASADLPTGS